MRRLAVCPKRHLLARAEAWRGDVVLYLSTPNLLGDRHGRWQSVGGSFGIDPADLEAGGSTRVLCRHCQRDYQLAHDDLLRVLTTRAAPLHLTPSDRA